jgi:hypothetical protein
VSFPFFTSGKNIQKRTSPVLGLCTVSTNDGVFYKEKAEEEEDEGSK